MIRFAIAVLLLGLLFAGPVSAQPHVGWLQASSPAYPPFEGFRQGLRDLGYTEGRNIVIDVRSAHGDYSRMPALAKELADLRVAVIYAGGDQGLRAAKQATNSIPIVAVTCDLPDAFIASLARPGGSATGVTCVSSDLGGKRLQLLKEMIPRLSRVAVMYNPKDGSKRLEYRNVQGAAGTLGLTVAPFEIAEKPGGFSAAFSRMRAGHFQGLVILSDSFMNTHQARLADLALKNRMPTMYGFRGFTEAGGLVSYGADLTHMHRRAAAYVDKILKGAKPGDLPVEQPTKFELVLNQRTAKTLGLAIPPTVLLRAERVIE